MKMADKKTSLQKISCDSCGAELVFNPKSQVTLCNFCGSTFEIEKADENVEIMVPDGILPFRVTKDQFQEGVLEWLSEGDYTPDDILTSSVFGKYNGVYLPMHLYSGQYSGNWSASSGYNRTEHYTARDSNGKLVNKTRTVTDWRPSNGQVGGPYTILGFAGTDIKPEVAVFGHGAGFDKGDLKKFDIKYTLNFSLLEFVVSESDVWDSLGQIQLDAIGEADIEDRIPGDKYKDLRFYLSYKHDSILKAYVPTWIAYYKYKDKEYHACIDGLNLSRKDGIRPEDEDRKKKAKQFFIPGHIGCFSTVVFWMIIFFGIESYYQEDYFGWGFGAIGATLVLYGIGQLQKWLMIKKSKEKRQEILRKIKSGESVEPEQIEE